MAVVEEKQIHYLTLKKGWSKRRSLQEVITLTCCIEWKRQFETLCDFSLVTGHHGTVVEIFFYDTFDCYTRKPEGCWMRQLQDEESNKFYISSGRRLKFLKGKMKDKDKKTLRECCITMLNINMYWLIHWFPFVVVS